MKRLLCLVLSLSLLLGIAGCSSQTKDFQDEIDSLVTHYNKAKNADNGLTKDVSMKVAAGDLWKLSKMYQDSKNQNKLDEYLDEAITQEMFETVYQYNQTNEGTQYQIEKDLIEHFAG